MLMPRRFSRIHLEVTGVRVQRLQDISEEDAKAEGVNPKLFGAEHHREFTRGYITLWNEINKARGQEWKTNPWVAVIEFNVSNQGGLHHA